MKRSTNPRDRLDAAAQELALSCLPLAYSLARRYASPTTLPLEDARSVAVDALLYAATRYDPARGALSTFTHLAVRHRLFHAVRKHVSERQRQCPRTFSSLDPADDLPFDPPDKHKDGAGDDELFQRAADVLPPRLSRLVWAYYGEGQTMPEIGGAHGISKERVRLRGWHP